MSCCGSSSRRTKRVYRTRDQTYILRYLSSNKRVSVACRECSVSLPFVSRPLPQLYGAIRRVILRQAHPSLRSGVLAFLVLLASDTVYLRTAFVRLIQLDALHSRPASS